MVDLETSLCEFFERHERAIHVELKDVQGSSPRNSGTSMFVSTDDQVGTIGGGQLEHIAIERARMMLHEGILADQLDIPLGPDIGQCCGGRVRVSLVRMGRRDRELALKREEETRLQYPQIYVLGAGHVGRALANQLQHLPVSCVLVDTRVAELSKCTAAVETRLCAIPEFAIRSAPAGSAFVVLTHDHALDFLLTSEALQRTDARYVGMIGSKTKRTKFMRWSKAQGTDVAMDRLTCPIGANGSSDKRPSVIASFVIAEIMAELTAEHASTGAGAELPRSDLRSSLKNHDIQRPVSKSVRS